MTLSELEHQAHEACHYCHGISRQPQHSKILWACHAAHAAIAALAEAGRAGGHAQNCECHEWDKANYGCGFHHSHPYRDPRCGLKPGQQWARINPPVPRPDFHVEPDEEESRCAAPLPAEIPPFVETTPSELTPESLDSWLAAAERDIREGTAELEARLRETLPQLRRALGEAEAAKKVSRALLQREVNASLPAEPRGAGVDAEKVREIQETIYALRVARGTAYLSAVPAIDKAISLLEAALKGKP